MPSNSDRPYSLRPDGKVTVNLEMLLKSDRVRRDLKILGDKINIAADAKESPRPGADR